MNDSYRNVLDCPASLYDLYARGGEAQRHFSRSDWHWPLAVHR